MIFLSNFIHAWFFCIAPLTLFNYKPTLRQHMLFTLVYGFSVYLSRRIYEILPVPFGTHTFILIAISVALFVFVCKVSFKISLLCSIIVFIVLVVSDGIISLPVMNLLNITIKSYDESVLHRAIVLSLGIVPLVIMVLVGKLVNIKKQLKSAL